METYLETERLLLRRLTASDADDLVALHNDPEVMHYINGGRPTPREVVVGEELPVMMARLFLAAIEKGSGQFLGWFHLRALPGRPEDEPELGYRLRRSAWGRGYASEGARALVELAFRELGARRVYAEAMAVHAASRRVMEKSGLTYVRTFFQDWPDAIEGDEHGDVEYELLRSDWERRT